MRARPRLSTGYRGGNTGAKGSTNRTSLRDLYRRGRNGSTTRTNIGGGASSGARPKQVDLTDRYRRAPRVGGTTRSGAKPRVGTTPRAGAKPRVGGTTPRAGAKPRVGGTTPRAGARPRVGGTTPRAGAKPRVGGTTPRAGARPRVGGTTPRAGGKPIRRGAGDRYRTPGQPIASPIQRRRNVIAPTGPRRNIGVTTPRTGAPRIVRTPRPRLTAPRRGAIDARLSVGRSGRRFSNTGYYGRNFYGGLHWYHHRHSLGFNFGFGRGLRFGLYSFPFYYGCYYPWQYYNSCYDYVGYWNGYSPYYSSCWWWPRSYCYSPIVYYGGGGGGGGTSFVNISYGDTSSAGGTRVTATSRVPESKESVAQRHIGLGDFYFKEGRFKEAAESYTRALTYAPDDASLHFLLADALFAIGDYHYAAYIIGEALRLDPEMAGSEADKREFYGKPEQFEEQLETLRGYVDSKPYDAAAHLVLGYNLNFSAQREKAIATFRRVLEIEPGNEPAKLFLGALTGPAAPADPAGDKAAEKKTDEKAAPAEKAK